MKFYVASIVENKKEVRSLIKELENQGHAITRDWTKEDHVIRPYHLNSNHTKEGFDKVTLEIKGDEIIKESEKIAEKDIAAVIDADLFVLLVSKDIATGYNVELGAAIRNNMLFGKPKIILVGPYNNRSALYHHPTITRITTTDELLKYTKTAKVDTTPGRFLVATGAIIEHKTSKKILLLKRSPKKDFSGGIWEYITGRMNQFEKPEDGLRREIKEEAGIDVEIIKPISTYHIFRGEETADKELIGIMYRCLTEDNKITLSEEHTEYKWVTPEEALQMIPKPSMQADIRAYIDELN